MSSNRNKTKAASVYERDEPQSAAVNDENVWDDFFDSIADTPSSQLTFLSSQISASDGDKCGAGDGRDAAGDSDITADAVISNIKSVFRNASNCKEHSWDSINADHHQTAAVQKDSPSSPSNTIFRSKRIRDYKEYRTHTSEDFLSAAIPLPKKACTSISNITDLRALAISHQQQESIEYVVDGLRVRSAPNLMDLNPILLSTLLDLANSPQSYTSMRILERLTKLIAKKRLCEPDSHFLRWLVCVNVCLILKALTLSCEKAEARKLVGPHACLIYDVLANYNDQSLPIAMKSSKESIDKRLGEAGHIIFIELLTVIGAIKSWDQVELVCAAFSLSLPQHKITCVNALESYLNQDYPVENPCLLDQIFDTIQYELAWVSDLDTRLLEMALVCLKSASPAKLTIFNHSLLDKAIAVLSESLKASHLLDVQTNFALYLCGILTEMSGLNNDTSMLAKLLTSTKITDSHLKGYIALLVAQNTLEIPNRERAKIRESLEDFLVVAGSEGLKNEIEIARDRIDQAH